MSNNLTRDNLLFTVIGVLLGFISGYLLHEVVSARQPPRLVAGMQPAGAQGAAMPGGEVDPTAQPGSGAPPMKEIQELRDYVEKNPKDADAIRKLADLNFDISNWNRARELYLRLLELKPNDADALSDLGFCYRELKDYDQALASFHRAQAAKPEHWESYFNEVVVLGIDQTRFDEADKVLAKLRQMQPDNPNVEKLTAEIAKRRAAAA